MYVLTEKAKEILRENKEIRSKVAMNMGLSDKMIKNYIEKRPESIAYNEDAIDKLLDETGLTTKDLITWQH